MPPEVNQFFIDGKQQYINQMDIALTGISNLVAERLNTAKQKIAQGKQQIQEYVAGLPQNLQQVGQQAAQNIQGKFDQLEQSVTSKQDELINTLSQKYSENLQAVDTRIEEMKQQNQGLMDKFTNLMGGTIKTILEIKSMLESALAGAAGAVSKIILDPVGFLGNLVTGLRQGFEGFVGNIGTHLQSGLVAWLTGTMGSMGIQIPDDVFSLPGIFNLATQVLGLTWDYIRGKATKMFGAQVVSGMEEGVEMFGVLRTEGPMGLWEQVKEDFGDLKEQVIDQIKEMVVTQVIQAGVVWILSLLNPASAFVKAAKAIYDIVMFFVNRGSQVMALVQAVTQAVSAIASGAVDGAAKLVEGALAKALPVVIGFLAAVAGVGGLAQKVSKIVGRIKKRIDDAIEKVLKKARKLFKKKGKGNKDEQAKALGFEKGEVEVGEGHGDPEHDTKVSKGLKQIDREETKYTKEEGKITQKDAEKVAAKVKNDNPIFKSIAVVDGGKTWDYRYIASRGTKKGEKKNEGNEDDEVKRAKQAFGENSFSSQDLLNCLKFNNIRTAQRRLKKWTENPDIYGCYRIPGTRDDYTFDKNKGTLSTSTEGKHASTHVNPDTWEILAKPKNGRSPVRENFYKKNFRNEEQVLKQSDSGKQTSAGEKLYYCQNKGTLGPNHKPLVTRDELEIDHIEDVAIHWNREGHNMTQEERNKWYDDISNLQVFCKSCNRAKKKYKYIRKVGKKFRGSNE
ncbi:MAG: GH-E family nuclease [Cyanobacteriota bacterium]|nr:GH-E family nuclease [Cyanobacteriota bacterium]